MLEETVAAPARDADALIGIPEALATLPDQQRRAILLREWQGLSYREVAAELGLTQSAVETLIFRARRSLAAALEHPDSRRPRALHGLNLGGLGAALKSVLVGGAGAKVAATVAVAATATVVAVDPVGWHRPATPDSAPKPAARVVEQPAPTGAAPSPSGVAAQPPTERSEHLLVAPPAAGAADPREHEVADAKGAGKADSPAWGKENEKAEGKVVVETEPKGKANGNGKPKSTGNGKGKGKGSPNGKGNGEGKGNGNGEGKGNGNGAGAGKAVGHQSAVQAAGPPPAAKGKGPPPHAQASGGSEEPPGESKKPEKAKKA